jgi:SagB-type dehydrogenase family enzyme
MNEARAFYRWTELDRTTFPAFAEGFLRAEAEGLSSTPRSYPGYPQHDLPRPGRHRWASLDATLARRRCVRHLGTAAPSPRLLGRLLYGAHGVTAAHGSGPTPSAGGLQSLELYLVHFADAWLPPGLYHYERVQHRLAQLAAGATRAGWEEMVPSLLQSVGGSLLWVLVGDGDRIAAKYGERGYRFLLLEAGHLMQNLCLLSESLGWCTVPLGGFFEREVARQFHLPRTDLVLYLGLCGSKEGSARVGPET